MYGQVRRKIGHELQGGLGRLRRWFVGRDLAVYAGSFLVLTLVWAFAELAERVVEPGGLGFDQWLLYSIRSAAWANAAPGPSWFEALWLDLTALGSAAVVVVLSAAVIGYLILSGRRRAAWVVVGALIGAGLWSSFLKDAFDRPRPELASRYVHVSSPSFPSGHSLLAAVVYPMLGSIAAELARTLQLKLYLALTSLALALLVGLSRIFLGVHYPTDVLAGWCVGLGWATVCWLVMRAIDPRRPAARAGSDSPKP